MRANGVYEGELCVCMRDFNSAGRKAIRNGDLRAGLHEYAFHHLKRSWIPTRCRRPCLGRPLISTGESPLNLAISAQGHFGTYTPYT